MDIVFEESEGDCNFDQNEILQQVNEKIKDVATSLNSDYSNDVEELKMTDWYVNCTKVEGKRKKRSLKIEDKLNMSHESKLFGKLSPDSEEWLDEIHNVSMQNDTEANRTSLQSNTSSSFTDESITLKSFLVKWLNQLLIIDESNSTLEDNPSKEFHATTSFPTNSSAQLSQETESINTTNQHTLILPLANMSTTVFQGVLSYIPPTLDNIDKNATTSGYSDKINDTSGNYEANTTEHVITTSNMIDDNTVPLISPKTFLLSSSDQDITSTSTTNTVTIVDLENSIESNLNSDQNFLINKETVSSYKRKIILHIIVELKYQDKAKYISTSQMEPISQLFDFYLEDHLLQDDWQLGEKALKPSFKDCSLYKVDDELTCSNGEQNIKSACCKFTKLIMKLLENNT